MNALIVASLEAADVSLLFMFPEALMSKHEREVVRWVMDYTSRYSQPPDIGRLTKQFDTFVPVKSTDPLADVYQQTLQRKRNIYAREYLVSVQDQLKRGDDPLPLIAELHNTIREGASDVTLYTRFDRSTYHRVRVSFPYEIAQIDRYTGGVSAGDLVYLVGRLGTGKTTFASWQISKWLQKGYRMLMLSNENRPDDVVSKVDAYMGGWNPLKKRTMDWTPVDIARIQTVQLIASKMKGEMVIPNKPVKNTAEIQALIHAYRPDIVVVDGIYLLGESRSTSQWEKITDVSRALKRVAEQEGVPVVGITQASRAAADKHVQIEHIAYADALAQDADLVLTINSEEGKDLFVECIKNRWGAKDWGFFMRFFFDTMTARVFDAKHVVEEDDSHASSN